MVGPVRTTTAGKGAVFEVTLLGLGKITLSRKNGLKGAELGLWKEKYEENLSFVSSNSEMVDSRNAMWS